ncbi:MAG TPA: EAL domain-containing protein [Rhodanobacteraceae bacterium]|nr:EAL domain-containing protein [Rhodanobacteraceae bacterium]
MATQLSQQNPDAELQVAFRQHLPQRLRTLLRRARTQCRNGWDCNVLRSLHDEIGRMAGTCGRYGMLETGERLLALESALAPSVASHQIPDSATTTQIDALLDSLRPHLQQASPGPGLPAWMREPQPAMAKAPFPRCEIPPGGYWLQLDASRAEDVAVPLAAISPPLAPQPDLPVLPEHPRGPRVRIVNDDDPLMNELLLRLDQQSCDVELVDRMQDLLEQLQGAPPDLVILAADGRTPLEQLAAVLREARRDPAHRVRLLVLLRETDVELRLRALRAGADRCIALPATPAEAVGAALELASIDEETPYRVLIVDDDAPQALFAQAILRRAGMETRVLGESLPVLEELDRFQPDLLLLDLNMPDCDGFELTALIREREGYVNTPIVFLSGDQDEDRQFAALDAGGDDFLMKPIRPAHLVAAVTNRVRRARAAASRTRRKRRRDAATGLHERAQLLDALSEHLAAAGGYTASGGLLALELRDAAKMRDRAGIAAFDQVLTQLGEFILRHTRAGNMTARDGAAGFLIFAPARNQRELLALAGELIAAVQDERFGAQASAVRLDCAVCAFDASTSETAAALAAVQQTLNVARAQPDRIAVHSASGPDPDSLAQHISAALAHGSFELAFQPIIPILGAAGPHYQALLRLNQGAREFLAAELIPVAIRAGYIAAVDAWVVERCIEILAQHQRDGDPVCLCASQSLRGWDDVERRAQLAARLAAAGAIPESLILEFRCEEARSDLGALVDLCPALKQAGVQLSLAGVDAEAVSAGWIEHLPLDFIKLASDLAESDLEDVVRHAHSHDLRVIAPHIETVARADRLRAAGVDLLQGNYFRPPAATLDHAFPGTEA